MANENAIFRSATEFYLYNSAYDALDPPWVIYEKWRRASGIVVSDPAVLAFLIQTFEEWKTCSKDEIESIYLMFHKPKNNIPRKE